MNIAKTFSDQAQAAISKATKEIESIEAQLPKIRDSALNSRGAISKTFPLYQKVNDEVFGLMVRVNAIKQYVGAKFQELEALNQSHEMQVAARNVTKVQYQSYVDEYKAKLEGAMQVIKAAPEIEVQFSSARGSGNNSDIIAMHTKMKTDYTPRDYSYCVAFCSAKVSVADFIKVDDNGSIEFSAYEPHTLAVMPDHERLNTLSYGRDGKNTETFLSFSKDPLSYVWYDGDDEDGPGYMGSRGKNTATTPEKFLEFLAKKYEAAAIVESTVNPTYVDTAAALRALKSLLIEAVQAPQFLAAGSDSPNNLRQIALNKMQEIDRRNPTSLEVAATNVTERLKNEFAELNDRVKNAKKDVDKLPEEILSVAAANAVRNKRDVFLSSTAVMARG